MYTENTANTTTPMFPMFQNNKNDTLAVLNRRFYFEKNGVKMKLAFKDNLCKSDEFGRPMQFWDPVKKEHYVYRVVEKGQACRIVRVLPKMNVVVEFCVVGQVDLSGNLITSLKRETIPMNLLEEVPVDTAAADNDDKEVATSGK